MLETPPISRTPVGRVTTRLIRQSAGCGSSKCSASRSCSTAADTAFPFCALLCTVSGDPASNFISGAWRSLKLCRRRAHGRGRRACRNALRRAFGRKCERARPGERQIPYLAQREPAPPSPNILQLAFDKRDRLLAATAAGLYRFESEWSYLIVSPQLVTSRLVSMRRFEPVTWRSHQKKARG